jgi:hypothetical protein
LHQAEGQDDETILEEAIAEARRTGINEEDVEKADSKLSYLRSLTEEQKSVKAAKERQSQRKSKAFLLVKKDDGAQLAKLLEDAENEEHAMKWQDWRDHAGRTLLQFARELQAASVQRLLANVLPAPPQSRPSRMQQKWSETVDERFSSLPDLASDFIPTSLKGLSPAVSAKKIPVTEPLSTKPNVAHSICAGEAVTQDETKAQRVNVTGKLACMQGNNSGNTHEDSEWLQLCSQVEALVEEDIKAQRGRAAGKLAQKAGTNLRDTQDDCEGLHFCEVDAVIEEDIKAQSERGAGKLTWRDGTNSRSNRGDSECSLSAEETEWKAQALRAVVQDDTDALAEVLDRLPVETWSIWKNKAGKDLITLAEERGSSGAYSLLARLLGLLKEMKRESFDDREAVWVLVQGDVQPRRATVLADTSAEAEQVLVEFWDDDMPPCHIDRRSVMKTY